MHVHRISKSDALPLPIEDVMLDLRIDDTIADAPTVTRLLRGAAGFLERRTGYVINPGTFEAIICGGWPFDAVEIMRGPLRSVTAIQYLSDNAVWSDVTALTDFQISALEKSFVVSPLSTFDAPEVFSDLDSVKIVFEAGFASDESDSDAPQMDDELKTILMMLTGHYYQNRELFAADKIAQIEMGAGALLASVRQYW